MLTCPKCRSPLARKQGKAGLYYDCPEGHGRAIALPVLRKLVAPEALKQLWGKIHSGETVPGVNCPSCKRPTREVKVDTGPQSDPILLDVCQPCSFLWFDPQELGQLPEAPPPPPDPDDEIPQELKEKIAIAKVEQMREDAERETEGLGPDAFWKWAPALLGMPVEQGNACKPNTRPWLTWIIALLCIAATVYSLLEQSLVEDFGLIPDEALRYGGLTFLTSFFLHGDWWHLIGNLYFLLIFGDNVEGILGRWRYALLLFGAAFVGAALHIALEPQSDIPCVGASGGISGVIAYYAFQFPRARLGFIIIFFWVHWIFIPAWFALVAWFGMQALMVYMQVNEMSNISALAHVGGAAIGIALWLFVRFGKKPDLGPPGQLAAEG